MEINAQEQEVDFKGSPGEAKPEPELLEEEKTAEPEPEPEDPIEVLEPRSEPREWILRNGDVDRTYVQKPLGFMNRMEFFSLLGDTISKAMSGPDGMTIDGMLDSFGGIAGDTLTAENLMTADSFVKGIARVSTYTPELLRDCFCIWLNVPMSERMWAKNAMNNSPEDGGLSDDDGFEIIETFFDQNWEAINDFFVKRVRELASNVQRRRQKKKSTKRGTGSSRR